MKLLFHLVPPTMLGQFIHPLNELRRFYPDVYQTAVWKYLGREHVLDRQIPPLGHCTWGEVVFLSAIHPQVWVDAMRAVGIPLRLPSYKAFALDPRSLDPAKTAAMIWRNGREEFVNFDPAQLEEFARLPPETVQYYQACWEADKRPLLFHYVPHVLYRGSLDVSGAGVVETT